MTGITLIRSIDMRSRFTRCHYTIMTGFTGTLRFIVIYGNHGHPYRTVMTCLAEIAGENMINTLARSRHTIMAGYTAITCCRVIKGTHEPVVRCMTNIAGFNRGNMIDTLASSDHAIMTTFTGAIYLSMIYKDCRNPTYLVMTRLTDI